MILSRIALVIATLILSALFLLSDTPEIGVAALVLTGLIFMVRPLREGQWKWHLLGLAITAPVGIAAMCCLGITGAIMVVLGISLGVLALGVASDLHFHYRWTAAPRAVAVAAGLTIAYLVALFLLRDPIGLTASRGIAAVIATTAAILPAFAGAVAVGLQPSGPAARTAAPGAR